MDLVDPAPQSFIIKVWLEETVEETGRAKWRGRITHVPSEGRRTIESLDAIADFMVPYLENMGVEFQESYEDLGA